MNYIEDINIYVEELFKKGFNKIKCYKHTPVFARKGKEGETIKTIMSDGFVETINDVECGKDGEMDWVVTNANGEQICVSNITFKRKYKLVDKEKGIYLPKYKLTYAIKINEDISFIAPWGDLMTVKKGGFLILNSKHNIYGIQKNEFLNTYKIVK